MPIPLPVTQTKIATASWGIPLTEEVNRLTAVVDALMNPVWTNISFAIGFGSQDNSYPKPSAAVIGGMVHLRGLLYNLSAGTITGQVVVGTLVGVPNPLSHTYLFPIVNNGGDSYRMHTNTNGTLNVWCTSTKTWPQGNYLSLDGVTFPI